jgi:DOPA 4,5-dioxygenase
MPWLMLNRGDLAILVHPETGRPKRDHLDHAIWLGEVLEINAGSLPEEEAPEPEIVPNTQPTMAP